MKKKYFKSGQGESWGAWCVPVAGQKFWVSEGTDDGWRRGWFAVPWQGTEGVAHFVPPENDMDCDLAEKTLTGQ